MFQEAANAEDETEAQNVRLNSQEDMKIKYENN